MGSISKNFSYSEFEASETAKAKGILNAITTVEVRENIRALVLEVLQPLRDAWGKPLHVNSGYRCPQLNAAVGGVPTSQHTVGEAADIKAENPIMLAQLAYDLALPFDQMIIYPTFVHFSHRRGGPQRCRVLYNKSYKGRHITTLTR
jgi:hypothetical protein